MAENTKNEEKGKTPALKKADSEAMRQSDKQKDGKTKLAEIEEKSFPTTLEGFKYEFNENGELRHIETKEPFNFHVSENMKYNQKHYEALGEIITEAVYELLESKGNLKKHFIPLGAKPTDPRSFIFMSEDALTNPDKLMILIHGSGVVRAGQWTRKLIINEDLDHGTQLPYIKKGMEEGYGIIVLNTNLNKAVIKGKEKKIKENSDPEEHGFYVWRNFIKKAKAKHIAIVAHSYGGVVTNELAVKYKDDFEKRVFAIAFTDSVHSVAYQFGGAAAGKCFEKKAINWVTSSEPRDTPMRSKKGDATRVSAGHEKHEWTSWASFDSVFKYFEMMYTGKQSTQQASPGEIEVATEATENLGEDSGDNAKKVKRDENDIGENGQNKQEEVSKNEQNNDVIESEGNASKVEQAAGKSPENTEESATEISKNEQNNDVNESEGSSSKVEQAAGKSPENTEESATEKSKNEQNNDVNESEGSSSKVKQAVGKSAGNTEKIATEDAEDDEETQKYEVENESVPESGNSEEPMDTSSAVAASEPKKEEL